MKYILPLLVFLALFSCKKNPYPDSDTALTAMFGKDDNADIVESRMVNLDEDPELEAIMIGRKGREEVIAFFDKTPSGWQQTFNKHFSLVNLGPLDYDKGKRNWVAGNSKDEKSYVFKKILIDSLPGDNFNSVFAEVLTEQPPLGLFSVPYAFRKNKVILDGLNSLATHEKLQKDKRVTLDYVKDNKSIRIFPEDSVYSQEFVFNGFELVPSLGGIPAASLIGTEIIQTGKSVEIVLNLKNRGGLAQTTYLSLSFPGNETVIIPDKEGYKFYAKGTPVYSNLLKKYIPAEYPLYEITKEGWSRNVKFNVRFTVDSPDETKKLIVYLRSSVKVRGQTTNIPNEYTSAETGTDQQGFPVYKLETDLKK